ncbi:hypothetical protein [Methylosinus sp. Ce-a6]|uniref:hypothetical protein n=1 Tax=Methylosinus sp. Ce-a6 TaxID=2172005 RepID=UPI0013598881|nr:hypothetical protein [Methylosinus sp. Ce-a6]
MGKLAIADEVLEEVAAAARARGVSSETLAQELLLEGLRGHKSNEALRELMEAIAAMTPRDVEQTDSVELLREDRDR